MSQKGLLSETELSEQIQRYFDMRLDKEALMRPTKEMVREVYRRFLDQINEGWMKPKRHGHEPTQVCKMLYCLKKICQRFNVGIEASVIDLTAPSKNRTKILFNLLIYYRALYDEGLERQQQREKELHEQQDQNALVAREVSKVRAQTEDLAFKIGQSKSLEQVRAELEEGYARLRAAKERCDELEGEKAAIKECMRKEEEIGARLLKDHEENKKRIEQLNRRKDLASLQAKLEEAESNLRQLKIANDIKRAEDNQKMRMLDSEAKEEVEKFNAESKNIQADIKALKETKEDIKKKCEEDIKATQETLQMIKQAVDDFRGQRLVAIQAHDRALEALAQEYKVDLDQILRPNTDAIKNSTFIKIKSTCN